MAVTACEQCGAPLAAEGAACARCAVGDSEMGAPLPEAPRPTRGRGPRARVVLIMILAASATVALWVGAAQGSRNVAHPRPAPAPTLSLNDWQQQADLTLTYAAVAAHPDRYRGAKIMWECQISTPAARDPAMAARRAATCQVYGAGGAGAGGDGDVLLRLPAGAAGAAVTGATVIIFGTVARPAHLPRGGATAGDPWIDVAYLVPDQFGGD